MGNTECKQLMKLGLEYMWEISARYVCEGPPEEITPADENRFRQARWMLRPNWTYRDMIELYGKNDMLWCNSSLTVISNPYYLTSA